MPKTAKRAFNEAKESSLKGS